MRKPMQGFQVQISLVSIRVVGRSWWVEGGGALCVEIGFSSTFPRNQDVTMRLKFELIFMQF